MDVLIENLRVRRLDDILPQLEKPRTMEQEIISLKLAVSLLKERVFKLEHKGKDE